MSLVYCDGFDAYTVGDAAGTALPAGMWDGWNSSGVIVNTGKHGNALQMGSGSGNIDLQKAIDVADRHATNVVAFWVYLGSLPTGSNICDLVRLRVGANFGDNFMVSFAVFPSGQINIYTVNAGAPGSGSTGVVIPTAQWVRIEAKVVVGAAGSAELRVNGVQACLRTGFDTRAGGGQTVAAGWEFVRAGSASGGGWTANNWPSTNRIDDVVILNGVDDTATSGAAWNDFPGEPTVTGILPNGNGNSSQLVGSDADSVDNYQHIDETTTNDTDYVESPTDGNKDTYTYGNVPAGQAVAGLIIFTRAHWVDTAKKLAVVARDSGGTEEDSADVTLTNAPAWYKDRRRAQPGGGGWDATEINGSEFGAKVRP